MRDISETEVEKAIGRRKEEILELETALATIRRLIPSTQPKSTESTLSGELAGATIRASIKAVLSECRKPLSHREIVEKAIQMGYRSPNPDGDIETTGRSFVTILRAAEFVKKNNSGLFSLNVNEEGPLTLTHPAQTVGLTRADAMESILRKLNRPASVGEILDALQQEGHSVPSDRRSAYNSVYGSLKTWSDRFARASNNRWTIKDQG